MYVNQLRNVIVPYYENYGHTSLKLHIRNKKDAIILVFQRYQHIRRKVTSCRRHISPHHSGASTPRHPFLGSHEAGAREKKRQDKTEVLILPSRLSPT